MLPIQSLVTRQPFRTFLAALAVLACTAAAAMARNPPAAPAPTKPGAGQPPATQPSPKDDAPQVYVLMSTNMGDVAIELDRQHAPMSVTNFLKYADAGYYEGTIFHRVIPTFMIQGGGYTADMQPKKGVGLPVKNEWQNGLKNRRGTLAMARLGGAPDSATAQFFINVVDNPFLDEARDGAGYAVFAKVLAGMKTVDDIRMLETTVKAGQENVPKQTVEIKSIKRMSKEDADAMVAAEKPKPRAPAQQPPATQPGQ